eukprot:SAG31_NODE_2132_length_6374_cov_2.836813_3_plen_120_part_00
MCSTRCARAQSARAGARWAGAGTACKVPRRSEGPEAAARSFALARSFAWCSSSSSSSAVRAHSKGALAPGPGLYSCMCGRAAAAASVRVCRAASALEARAADAGPRTGVPSFGDSYVNV